MTTTAKTAGRGLASNWDLAVTSSALLLIVGGIARAARPAAARR
jgi:hypothetical protein